MVGQQRVHVLEAAEELLAGVEDRVVGHRHSHDALDERSGQLGDLAADGLDLLHPPLHRLWQRQQPKRLARGRSVHDHHVVVARVVVIGDPQERTDLVHAG